MAGMNRQTEQTIGIVALSMMALFLVLSLVTADGDVTPIFIIGAVIFLVVGLVMTLGSTGSSSGGQSQQQSVVFSDGQVVTQQSGVQMVCGSCQARVPEGSRFCPECGSNLGA